MVSWTRCRRGIIALLFAFTFIVCLLAVPIFVECLYSITDGMWMYGLTSQPVRNYTNN